ncbi:MAG: hypothetical protein WEA34_05200 [Gemmatimonadota bacterium]
MVTTDVEHAHTGAGTRGNLVYGAVYSAAIGGSVVSLSVLLIDALAGRALFTPSLLGSVLFFGASAETFAGIDLTAVALWTVVHVLGFLVLGTAASWLYQGLRGSGIGADFPTVLALVVLGEAMFLGANILAAISMTPFLRWAYRQGEASGR